MTSSLSHSKSCIFPAHFTTCHAPKFIGYMQFEHFSHSNKTQYQPLFFAIVHRKKIKEANHANDSLLTHKHIKHFTSFDFCGTRRRTRKCQGTFLLVLRRFGVATRRVRKLGNYGVILGLVFLMSC